MNTSFATSDLKVAKFSCNKNSYITFKNNRRLTNRPVVIILVTTGKKVKRKKQRLLWMPYNTQK